MYDFSSLPSIDIISFNNLFVTIGAVLPLGYDSDNLFNSKLSLKLIGFNLPKVVSRYIYSLP